MEKILIVASASEPREFNGQDGNPVKAVDLVLTDGINTFVASAVDRVAQRLIDKPLPAGTLVNANLEFKVRVVDKDGRQFSVQQVSLKEIGAMWYAK